MSHKHNLNFKSFYFSNLSTGAYNYYSTILSSLSLGLFTIVVLLLKSTTFERFCGEAVYFLEHGKPMPTNIMSEESLLLFYKIMDVAFPILIYTVLSLIGGLCLIANSHNRCVKEFNKLRRQLNRLGEGKSLKELEESFYLISDFRSFNHYTSIKEQLNKN